MTIIIKFIPEKKRDEAQEVKIKNLVENRNKVIAKWFGVDEEKDLTVNIHSSTSSIKFKINPNGATLGVFSGYVDGSKEIELINLRSVEPIFGDNLDKEISKLVDSVLIKFYLCKKFYFEKKNFRIYYKYLTDILAQILSETFRNESAIFDIKNFSEDKKYSKEKEIGMALFFMFKKSGINFILENVGLMYEDCDIKKSIFKIYNKSFNDVIFMFQREILDEEKKLQKTFNPGRVR